MIYGKPSAVVESALIQALLDETTNDKITWTLYLKPSWWWYFVMWFGTPSTDERYKTKKAGYEYCHFEHHVVLRTGRKLSLWLNKERICDNQALLTPLLGAVTAYVSRNQEPYLRKALGLPKQGKEK